MNSDEIWEYLTAEIFEKCPHKWRYNGDGVAQTCEKCDRPFYYLPRYEDYLTGDGMLTLIEKLPSLNMNYAAGNCSCGVHVVEVMWDFGPVSSKICNRSLPRALALAVVECWQDVKALAQEGDS